MLRSACSVARVLVQSVEKLDCLKNLNQLENFRNLKKIQSLVCLYSILTDFKDCKKVHRKKISHEKSMPVVGWKSGM